MITRTGTAGREYERYGRLRRESKMETNKIKISDDGRDTILHYQWLDSSMDANHRYIAGVIYDHAGYHQTNVKLYRVYYGKVPDQFGRCDAFVIVWGRRVYITGMRAIPRMVS